MGAPQKKGFFRKNLSIWILILVTALGFVCSAVKIFNKVDSRFYDLLLGFSKEPQEAQHIVLIDIDDRSLNEIGTWPWTRDILGNVLLRLKEFNAAASVFDIEYLSPSSTVADSNIEEITQQEFSSGYENMSAGLMYLAETFASGEIPIEYATEAAADFSQNTISPTLGSMQRTIQDALTRDNDAYFARTVQFFGNASLTVNTRDTQVDVSQEDDDYATERFLFTNVTDPRGLIAQGNNYSAKEEGQDVTRGFVPAIHAILSHANGMGFTNVVVDRDGTRRRVELLNEHNGKYAGQLAFAPLVRLLDVQEMERKPRSLVLKGALLPGAVERTNISIPLDAHGRMFVNWLHKIYVESFKHVGVYNFKYIDDSEAGIIYSLHQLLKEAPINEDPELFAAITQLQQDAQTISSAKAWLLVRCEGIEKDGTARGGGILQDEYDDYFLLKRTFFEDVTAFSALLLELDATARLEGTESLATFTTLYAENYANLQETLQDAFCIIGNSATGSTDLGVTPFQRRYANLGTHANVANTILQQDFITPIDDFVGILCAFLCALAVLLLSKNKSQAKKSVYGLLYVFIPLLIFAALMILSKVYVPLFVPLLVLLITYLSDVALNFISVEHDKNTLRRGFDSYVAPDVVSEIVKNPSLLGLGGVNKRMTALFSDVRKFSGFTECINHEEGEQHGAVRLVEILNGYLGMLSDAIMNEHGTIDKYVGDEIVSFFGAPIDNPNNAFDACVAGIRMKQAEDIYNAEHRAELPIHPKTNTPFLLKSRVGINTGDMVVGNMGTDKKLNYTIMGNNVNLASRLEGTNKAYDSWIMASESTWLEANSGKNKGLLVAKQLDCVKVINVEKPVQIYSIIGLRSELAPGQVEAAEIFNKGMEWYLKGRDNPAEPKDLSDFQTAMRYFAAAYRCYHTTDSQDPSYISTEGKMILRCKNFLANGLPKDAQGMVQPWDGVYTMTSK